jgi:hypothetical protein
MARASIPTLLSLDRAARILEIAPPHFNGVAFESVAGGARFPITAHCDAVIPQHGWQANDRTSREDFAREIKQAEDDLLELLGYPCAPDWIMQERHQYPKHHRIAPMYDSGYDARMNYKGLKTRYGRLISGGVRASEEIGADATVVYSDPDGDNYNELATITVAGLTSEPDWGEVRVYFDGLGDDDAYWIRYPRTVAYSAGTLVMTFDSWLFLQPDQFEEFPTSDPFSAIDASDTSDSSVYAQTVDVWRVYHDYTNRSARFIWLNYTDQQDGVFIPHEVAGFGKPIPATYDATDDEWNTDPWTVCTDEPDLVDLWYYAGTYAPQFIRENTYDPMEDWIARMIVQIAVSRLDRPLCDCPRLRTLYDKWRTDLAITGPDRDEYITTEQILNNPLGSHRGEVEAYKRLHKIVYRKAKVATA